MDPVNHKWGDQSQGANWSQLAWLQIAYASPHLLWGSVSLPWKSIFWPGLCCRLRREKEPCLAMRASPLPPLKMIFRLHRELWRTAIELRHQPGKVVISQKPLTDLHDLMNSTSFSMVWGHENHSNWCKHPAQHLSTVQNPLSPFILVGQWVSHNHHNPAHIG